MRRIALVAVFLVALVAPAWADFQAGRDAFERGDYATALKEWRPLAEQGDACAQLNLGLIHLAGQGVFRDFPEALKWIRMFAADRNVLIQAWADLLSRAYAEGDVFTLSDDDKETWLRDLATEIVPSLRAAAEQGDTTAQLYLAYGHWRGLGDMPMDGDQALGWLEIAAKGGQPMAQHVLGRLYAARVLVDIAELRKLREAQRKKVELGKDDALKRQLAWAKRIQAERARRSFGILDPEEILTEGTGARQAEIRLDTEGLDPTAEALKWYRLAAEQGYPPAQYMLGALYEIGRGVPRSLAMATKWYRKAAERGNADAHWRLGSAYRDGDGVLKNYAEAVKWFRRGAEKGDMLAQYELGKMYAEGKGVARNNVAAHMWFNLAASFLSIGWGPPAEARDALEDDMTTDEINEAQKLAWEWKPKPDVTDPTLLALVAPDCFRRLSR